MRIREVARRYLVERAGPVTGFADFVRRLGCPFPNDRGTGGKGSRWIRFLFS